MILFSTLLINVAIFAFLLVPGFIMGRKKLIERGALVSMTNILMYVAMPALVLAKLLEIDVRALPLTDVIVCLVAPVPAVLLAFAAAVLLFRRKDERGAWRASRFCSILPNCGFLGIPLAAALFPDHPEVVLSVSLFNVVATFLLLTFGVYILSGDRKHVSLRRACISPIGIAIVLGVILSLVGVGQRVPHMVTYATYLANLTTPLSMLVLGVELSRLRATAMIKNPGLYLCALIKLVLMPLAMLLLVCVLSLCGLVLSESARMGLFLATAVSTAASAPAMAQKYGADGEHAAALTLGTTLLCVVTLPALYAAVSSLGLL